MSVLVDCTWFCGCQVYYWNEKDSLYIPLVAGGRQSGAGLCVRDEGCCSTGSVMWSMGGVNGQLAIHNSKTPTKHGTYITLPTLIIYFHPYSIAHHVW